MNGTNTEATRAMRCTPPMVTSATMAAMVMPMMDFAISVLLTGEILLTVDNAASVS